MSTDPRFAEPTPFARLLYAHAVGVCGDACITISLAGSLFFQSPTHAARDKVLLYLLLTMAPFAIVAPVLGPALDRLRGGRRIVVIASVIGRAVLCFLMAQYISKPAPAGLLIYPLAFVVLVLTKGYSIAKSALVPALVKDDGELVSANSRLALMSAIAATAGGLPALGVQQLFGADWSLRLAGCVFIVASILAVQIPKISFRPEPDAVQVKLEKEEMHTPSIQLGGSAMAVLRAAIGFLVFFVAFALKHDLFMLGVVVAASAAGNLVGVLAAPVLRRSAREEVMLATALVLPAVAAVVGTLLTGSFGFVVAGFALAVGAATGRVGFDSLLQRDGPDAVRGQAFARFETRFQLVWVLGGLLGLVPIAARLGLFLMALGLAFAAVSYVGALRVARGRAMRTKLLPGAVDRAITRSRDQAMERVRRGLHRRSTRNPHRRDPHAQPPTPPSPPAAPPTGEPTG
jgi:MFS family permease